MTLARKPTDDEKRKIEAAIAKDDTEALESLFSKSNIDINADLGKWTALHWSVWSNKINCVKAIVNLRANVYAVDTNGEMPLKLAVDKEYSEIVYYLVKTVKQDIGNFDKNCQMKIKNILDTHVQYLSEQAFQDKDAKKLIKFMLDAKEKGYTLKARYSKILFSGSSGAGKSSFVNLLLNKKINLHHISTGVADSQQVMVTKKLNVMFKAHSDKESFEWAELNFDKEIAQLKLHLFQKMQQSLNSQQDSDTTLVNDSTVLPQCTVHPQCAVENDIVKSPVEKEFSSGASLDVWDVLTLLDTGGQPQFINMLPAINSSAMITFIVHNMYGGVKSLEDKVIVTHGNKKGKRTFRSYPMQYTNLELMKVLMSITNNANLRNSPFVDNICATKGETTSYLSFIGTHADMMTDEEIAEIDQKLTTAINEAKLENVWRINDQYLIPVDNTTAGSDIEDENASIIRAELSESQQKRDVYDVPITWIILELEIRKQCQEKNCSYILYTEVCNICKTTGLCQDEESIKNALRFHHLLGVLLFFEEVDGMKEFVITDHQWLFNNLTKLVCYTFQGKLIPNNVDLNKFQYEGMLSARLISKIDLELGDINIQYFLNLLIYLGIAAPIQEETGFICYFMPSILPAYTDKVDEHLQQYGSQTVRKLDYNMDVSPLLIQFSTGTLPRGVFCCLAVQLLQNDLGLKPRKSEKDRCRTFDNLITFRTPCRHSISLIDRVFYLEVQIRHTERDAPSVHYEFQCAITNALATVSEKLNLRSSELNYGFLCEVCLKQFDRIHMTKLSRLNPLPKYCDCDHDEETMLTESHKIWLEPVQNQAVKQQLSCESLGAFQSKIIYSQATRETDSYAHGAKLNAEHVNQILDQLAPTISSSINLSALMPLIQKHGLVTNDEYYHLTCVTTAPGEGAQKLLHYLKYKGDGTLQKLLCSLHLETEHAGHKDIATELTELLNKYGLQMQYCSECTAHKAK